MTKFKRQVQLLICCLLCLLSIGCISTKYVEQKQYLLTIKTLPENKTKQHKISISVDHIKTIAPFEQLDFLYRINSDRYLTDYYHSFLILLSEQLEPMLINYLKALGNFNLDTAAQNKLQVQITEFYADYRDRTSPQAVIALRFVLTRFIDGKPVILFDNVLRSSISLKEKNTDSLLTAWSIGLQNILKRGTIAIKKSCDYKNVIAN